MFDVLFKNYKCTILRVDLLKTIKNTNKGIIVYLFSLIGMTILFVVSIIISRIVGVDWNIEYYSGVTSLYILIFTGLIVRMKNLEKKEEYIIQKRKIAQSNMQEFVEFLVDNNISVKESSSIDSLIECANGKKEMTYETKSLCSALVGGVKYFVIPVITIVIKDYLTIDDPIVLFERAIFFCVCPMAIMFVIVLLAVNLRSIFETDKQKLVYLISDLLEVKCFNKTAVEMEETYVKQKSIILNN